MPLTIKGGSYISSKCEDNNENLSKLTKYKPTRFITEDKAKTISNKANAGHEINGHMLQKGIKDIEVYPYMGAMLKESNSKRVPMEEWSILSDHVKYVTHGESEAFQKLSIDSLNYRQNRDLYRKLNNEVVLKSNLNFGKSPEKLKADYLDVYKGVYTEVISTDRFDEDTDLSTTYLGQVDMTRNTEVKAEESFPMTARGYTKGQLLDSTDCEILIDTVPVNPICPNLTSCIARTCM